MQNRIFTRVLGVALVAVVAACSSTGVGEDAIPAQEQPHRVLPLEGGRNFRDMGGYKTVDGRQVKWGKLYRSGVLHNLTPEDYEFIKGLGIKTLVDLRSTEERASEPTLWRAGEIDQLSWDYEMNYAEGGFAKMLRQADLTQGDMEQLMDSLYADLVHQQKDHYRAMFERLITSGEPLLFHCTAGKDRTGVGAALILTALGVKPETVVADYVLSESVLDPRELMQAPEENADDREKAMFSFFSRLPEPALKALMGTRPSYIRSAFAEMSRQSGSVEGYIERELGVDAQELALLREHYLE